MEMFKRSPFLPQFMQNQDFRRVDAPIKYRQTTLLSFDPFLPDIKERNLTREIEKKGIIRSRKKYSICLDTNNIVKIREKHCFECGRRLLKNGFNNRLVILDRGFGKFKLRLQRKRCSKCGEIKPDYSSLAPKYGNYHENYKRIARQLRLADMNFREIRQSIDICLDVSVSISTIYRWIKEIQEPLHRMLDHTPVPSSGYWGYDEIFMKVRGKKRYQIDIIDVNTNFMVMARIMPNMGKKSAREVIRAAKRGRKMKLKGIIKDCSTNLGNLLQKFNWSNIKQQNCIVHVKKTVSKHVKASTGMSEQSKKPLPEEWEWLRTLFYNVIDSGNTTETYISLEILKYKTKGLKSKKPKHLKTAMKQIIGWLPKIINHRDNPYLEPTNNKNEASHREYERYDSFKRNMMTIEGAQFSSDICRFRHNFKQFPIYYETIQAEYRTYRSLLSDWPADPSLKGAGNYFYWKKKKYKEQFGYYLGFFNKYIAKI